MNARDARLAAAIAFIQSKGAQRDHDINSVVARDVMFGESFERDSNSQVYNFNKEVIDVLLAHGRQDTAHALCNTHAILLRVGRIETLIKWTLALTFMLSGLMIYQLSKGLFFP
jgi:hypothetical protein